MRDRRTIKLQKVLEACNIKLANVVSDIDGVSARQMLEALVARSSLAKGRSHQNRRASGAGRMSQEIPNRVARTYGVLGRLGGGALRNRPMCPTNVSVAWLAPANLRTAWYARSRTHQE